VTFPTTSQVSDRGRSGQRGRGARGFLLGAALAAFALLGGGCQTGIPPEALKSTPVSLKLRQQQTRKYEGTSERDILSASAGVLQDIGFNIDESETKLGLIVGSKSRTAVETGQVVGSVVLTLLTGQPIPWDDHQRIRVCLVTRPASETDKKAWFVRVTFQRTVWNNQNIISKNEAVEKPEIYQEFFEKLSKSLFLEAQQT
jgi:hypothetical protein